jgi:hypothetical protein
MLALSLRAKQEPTHSEDDEPLVILLYRFMLAGQGTRVDLNGNC